MCTWPIEPLKGSSALFEVIFLLEKIFKNFSNFKNFKFFLISIVSFKFAWNANSWGGRCQGYNRMKSLFMKFQILNKNMKLKFQKY